MMKLRIEKTVKILFIISIISLTICSAYFYSLKNYNLIYKIFFVISNIISTFAFKPNISIENYIKGVSEIGNKYELIGYMYALTVCVAPMCTIAYAYKVIQKIFNYSSWITPFWINKTNRIFIIGYNDIVKKWIINGNIDKNKRIVLLIDDNTSEDEINILINNKILYKKKNNESKKFNYINYLKKQSINKSDRIILFDMDSVKNYVILNELNDKKVLKIGISIDVYCEKNIIKKLIEEFYDNKIKDNNKKYIYNVEIFDYKNLLIQKNLQEEPLYNYYNKINIDIDKMTIHLLIIGFNDYSLSMLKNTLNLGVLSSNNKIIIDIVDKNINNVKNIIDEEFSNSYLKLNEHNTDCDFEYVINKNNADGVFLLRLYDININNVELFKDKFWKINNEDIINNIFISIDSIEQIYTICDRLNREYAKKKDNNFCIEGSINIYVKFKEDNEAKIYIDNLKSNELYKFIPITENNITISDVINNNIRYDGNIKFFDAEQRIAIIKEEKYKEGNNKGNKKIWSDNSLYDKESTFYRADSIKYTRWMLNKYGEFNAISNNEDVIIKYVKKVIDESKVFKDVIKNSIYITNNNDDDIVKLIESNTFIKEYITKEHRRWCYSLAAMGWGGSDIKLYNKDKEGSKKLKKHACMCDYETLSKKENGLRKYIISDLKPLLYIINNNNLK